jgi:hypothetical protein
MGKSPHNVAAWVSRDKKAKDWDRMREYNIELEDYLCQCISLFAQLSVAPPEQPERVKRVLDEKFLFAVKGD